MTFTKKKISAPKSICLFGKNNDKINFIVHGQGVFLFKNQEDNNYFCSFDVYDKDEKYGLKIDFYENSIDVKKLPSLEPLVDENNKQGLTTKKGAYYWLSIDSQNQRLYAGVGEARIENIIYEYLFPTTNKEQRKENKSFLESLVLVDLSLNNVIPLQFLRDPIKNKIPLLIRKTENLSMKDIASYTYLPKAHLSLEAQQLYDCISGSNFILDDSDFPNFSKAIEHSISTPGLWCHEKLKDKSTEFDKDKPNLLETYLRITLNQNNGESPGIPYVMEIWPIGHYSPVHNHGGSNAVIRVLHGKINVKLFSFLCNEKYNIEPFNEVQFVKDDITWISPTHNQIHQLENEKTNKETCVTIQCYSYDEKDVAHYDYFDYLDSSGNKKQYEPDSDMDFITFKETMKQEWNDNLKKIYDNEWKQKWFDGNKHEWNDNSTEQDNIPILSSFNKKTNQVKEEWKNRRIVKIFNKKTNNIFSVSKIPFFFYK